VDEEEDGDGEAGERAGRLQIAVTDERRWRTDSGVEDDDGRTDGADGADDEGLAKDGRGQ